MSIHQIASATHYAAIASALQPLEEILSTVQEVMHCCKLKRMMLLILVVGAKTTMRVCAITMSIHQIASATHCAAIASALQPLEEILSIVQEVMHCCKVRMMRSPQRL